MTDLILVLIVVLLILNQIRLEDVLRRLRRRTRLEGYAQFEPDPDFVTELQTLTAALSEVSRAIDQAATPEIFHRNQKALAVEQGPQEPKTGVRPGWYRLYHSLRTPDHRPEFL